LVFSTVHTNDAPSTVTRLIDLGVEPYLVSSSLVLVVAQRLVRKLCSSCKTWRMPTDTELATLRDLGLDPGELKDGKIAHSPGCDDCFQSGHQGRTAIYELLPMSEEIRSLVMRSAPASELKRKAVEEGMRTLRMDGMSKVVAGQTSPEEIMRVTQLDV
jgi:type II secretory ATPase GspE/PulE/Tfp pilus assembly ATPase PilB-like protein